MNASFRPHLAINLGTEGKSQHALDTFWKKTSSGHVDRSSNSKLLLVSVDRLTLRERAQLGKLRKYTQAKRANANRNYRMHCMDRWCAWCNLGARHQDKVTLPFWMACQPQIRVNDWKTFEKRNLWTPSTREILLRLLEHSIAKTDFQQLQNHCCIFGKTNATHFMILGAAWSADIVSCSELGRNHQLD